MNTEQIDFQSIKNALMALNKISTFGEKIKFLQQHPEILDEKTDILINAMINQANLQRKESIVQLLNKLLESVHYLRSIISNGLFAKTNNFSIFMISAKQASIATKRYFQESEHSLDEAIEAWENLLKHPDFENSTLELQAGILYDTAKVYSDRYNDQGNFKDLECAIAYYNRGVNLAPSDFPLLPNLLNNLGVGLRERYKRTNNSDDFIKSFFLYQQAYKKSQALKANLKEQFSVEFELLYLDNICELFFSQPYTANGKFNELKKVVVLYEMFVKLFSKNKPSHVFRNLGNGFYRLYEYSNSQEHLQKAIDNWEKSLEKIPKNSPERPKYLNNLAFGLSVHYTNIGTKKDLKQQAIKLYKESCEISLGSELVIQDGLQNARNWLNWAFNRQSWNEVQQAYNYVYQAGNRLVQIQLMREHQESWLKETQGLVAQVAYAFAKDNKLKKAVVTLERGLAQLLSEALARDRADLEQLKVQRHGDLYNRYQQAVEAWHNAQHVKEELVYERLQVARKEMDKTIVAIRKVEGYQDFLTAPEFADIITAVKDSALVYLLTTKAGGLALFITEDGEITPVWLPELTEETLQQTLDNYLRAYKDLLTHSKKDTYRQQWLNTLEATTKLLWKQVLAPLIQALPKSAQITLIPVGRLGLLPLHAAAWTEDNNTPTGKRYALDELTISYAPNARSLTEARKVAQQVEANRMLVVNDPQPVKAPSLSNLENEVRTVVATFAQPQIFKHKAATRQAILDALTNSTVLHFACHGIAKLDKPLESALIMANNEPLTVKDFLDLRLNGVRLAILSACETGIPGTELPDEVVNLPTGLLQAGVAGVVASLWSVSDQSTMLLMARFYYHWREENQSPAQALRQAQIWVRDKTEVEQVDFLKRQYDIELYYPSEERVYEHPYYWAAFGYTGVDI